MGRYICKQKVIFKKNSHCFVMKASCFRLFFCDNTETNADLSFYDEKTIQFGCKQNLFEDILHCRHLICRHVEQTPYHASTTEHHCTFTTHLVTDHCTIPRPQYHAHPAPQNYTSLATPMITDYTVKYHTCDY
jgi:hypothetical protein